MTAGAVSPYTLNNKLRLITAVRELSADLETPVSIYLKIAGLGPTFLLESVTGGEQVARYSFIGVNPSQTYILRDHVLERNTPEGKKVFHLAQNQDPLQILREEMSKIEFTHIPGLPPFQGGLVGYIGYDVASTMENAVPGARRTFPNSDHSLPDAIFLLADMLIAFDHAFGRLLLIANTPADQDLQTAREICEAKLDEIQNHLSQPLQVSRKPVPADGQHAADLVSNTSYDEYTRAVREAKEYILAGDIFQIVLSQRFSRNTSAEPFQIYRALRRINPSPYMFYFDFGTLATQQPLRLIGASPEMHVRLEGNTASIRPIAGTRPRGKSPTEDAFLQEELLKDPKERAEHVMLVDLARNDIGRVCQYGSIKVSELMGVERYSHVMHIVSHVEGELQPDFNAFDLMKATFPAGTVSGAPKIRAMQLIAELEKEPRGVYSGAVGYFSYDGSMDTCITIRTLVMEGNRISIQSGAGIVADSDPDLEYRETVNKARALAVAVEMAEEGL